MLEPFGLMLATFAAHYLVGDLEVVGVGLGDGLGSLTTAVGSGIVVGRRLDHLARHHINVEIAGGDLVMAGPTAQVIDQKIPVARQERNLHDGMSRHPDGQGLVTDDIAHTGVCRDLRGGHAIGVLGEDDPDFDVLTRVVLDDARLRDIGSENRTAGIASATDGVGQSLVNRGIRRGRIGSRAGDLGIVGLDLQAGSVDASHATVQAHGHDGRHKHESHGLLHLESPSPLHAWHQGWWLVCSKERSRYIKIRFFV